MQLSFIEAKDSNLTLSLNNIFLHSKYSPIKEAERFCDSIQFTHKYSIIFFIEPGLSYCYKFLKQKFPNTKIGVIRIIPELEKFNSDWDFSINYSSKNKFQDNILSLFSEEDLFSSIMINWNPSLSIFKNENLLIWNNYKSLIEQCKTVLVTREYFEKKWIINSCNYIKYINFAYKFDSTINKDILIFASGPSLKKSILKISSIRDNFFIICLSSATKTLLSYNIYPDVILTTDGGYWAGEHLKELRNKNIKIIVPNEGYVPKSLLLKNQIIISSYRDGICKKIFDICDINYLSLERNGTVSGTALKLALQLTNKNIYFFGLDLQEGIGFQHFEPNEIEITNSNYDNHITNKETRLSKSRFNSSSLYIYRNWFCSQKIPLKNVFRIIENQDSLGEITDISPEMFFNKIQNINYKNEKQTYIEHKFSFDEKTSICKKVLNYISEFSNTEEWKKQVFPITYFSIQNAENDVDKSFFIDKLNERNNQLLTKIRKILDE